MFIKKIIAKVYKEATKISPKVYIKTYFPELLDKYNKSIETYIRTYLPEVFGRYNKLIKDDEKRMEKATSDFRRHFNEINHLINFLAENNKNVWDYNVRELSECIEGSSLSGFILVEDMCGNKRYFELEETV